MIDLDAKYPHLSQLIQTTHQFTLEHLAHRAFAEGYPYFDLERLCHHAKTLAAALVNDPVFGMQSRQVFGYFSVIDEYIEAGIVKSPAKFAKKLLVPRRARAMPPGGAELLDTVAECEWAMHFREEGYAVEEEVSLPRSGDADFRLTRHNTELWVDCISPEPLALKGALRDWLVRVATRKWREKFSARRGADNLPACIAIMLLKADGVMPAVVFSQNRGGIGSASDQLWHDCPALVRVLIGIPPFVQESPRPIILADWQR